MHIYTAFNVFTYYKHLHSQCSEMSTCKTLFLLTQIYAVIMTLVCCGSLTVLPWLYKTCILDVLCVCINETVIEREKKMEDIINLQKCNLCYPPNNDSQSCQVWHPWTWPDAVFFYSFLAWRWCSEEFLFIITFVCHQWSLSSLKAFVVAELISAYCTRVLTDHSN